MTAPSTSPIKGALEQVIGLFPHLRHKVFSYKDDFNALWEFDPLSNSTARHSLVIIGDGIPDRDNKGSNEVATSTYLTPVDWAVAFSLFCIRKSKTCPNIIIIDANSYLDTNPGLKAIPVLMPSITIPEISNIVAHLSVNHSAQPRPADIMATKNFIAARLTRPSTPGDHHAIANLVGPLLLMENDDADSHVKALRCLMQEIGLLPLQSQQSQHREDSTEKEELLSGAKSWTFYKTVDIENQRKMLENLTVKKSQKLKLILLDDMWKSGWGKILCEAVFVKFKSKTASDEKPIQINIDHKHNWFKVYASESPYWLLNILTDWIKKRDPSKPLKDKRFEFQLQDDNTPDILEILFLDLRLFAGHPQLEMDFFGKIVALAERLNTTGFRTGSPPFDPKQIKRINEWLKKWRKNPEETASEDAEYIEALTIFPRLLALADFSLPIVLFSSTGRRDITEFFKDYHNIITVFDKPKFTVDISDDIAKLTREKFQKAMGDALDILKARKQLSSLSNTHNNDDITWLPKPQPTGDYIVELMLDETGAPPRLNYVGLQILIDGTKYPEAIQNVNTLIESRLIDIRKKKRLPRREERQREYLNKYSAKLASSAVTWKELTGATINKIAEIGGVKEVHIINLYPLEKPPELDPDQTIYELFSAMIEISMGYFAKKWGTENKVQLTYNIRAGEKICKVANPDEMLKFHGKYGYEMEGEASIGFHPPPGFTIPDSLRDAFYYSNERKCLCFKGVMTRDVKKHLLSLWADSCYKEKIQELFTKSWVWATLHPYSLRTIDKSTVKHLVDQVIKANPFTEIKCDIVRGYPLNKRNKRDFKHVASSHLFTDEIAGTAAQISTSNDRLLFHLIDGKLSNELKSLLVAYRHLCNGHVVDAIKEGAAPTIAVFENWEKRTTLEKEYALLIRDGAWSIGRDDFARLVKMLHLDLP